MVELDGKEYTIQTPQENATAAINWINQYCIDNQILNQQGDVVSIEIAPGSPLYLILLAFAYLATLCQNLVYGLGRMINIGYCSDRQLIAIGELVRMRRKAESYTTIRGLVTADVTGACTITPALTASLQVGGRRITFSPLYDVIVPPLGARIILLQATSLGAFFIDANQITTFDTNPANMLSMSTQSSIPGRPQESIDLFRRRIQTRNIAYSAIEKCTQALRNLPGISTANVYFNYDSIAQVIQGYTVDPRKAIVFIQGYHDDIAKTIFSYLLCDLMPLSISQSYTLLNGQVKIAYWDPPIFTPVFVEVFIRGNISVDMVERITTAVQNIALQINMADIITTADILRICQLDVPEVVFTGAQLRRVPADPWSQKVTSDSNELFELVRTNITVRGE